MDAYYANDSTDNVGVVGLPTSVPAWSSLRVSTTGSPGSSSSEDGSCTPSPLTPASASSSQPFPQNVAYTESLLPPADHRLPAPLRSSDHTLRPHSKLAMTHPYARIYAKKQAEAGKRRKTWNHALEKSIFTPHEM